MTSRRTAWTMLSIALAILAVSGFATAQPSTPEITAQPISGQLEVLQGTAVALGGEPAPDGPAPETCRWEIVQGEGGALYPQSECEVIFQAPTISDPIELFVIRMAVTYPGDRAASTTVHIRVHRDPPEQLAGVQAPAPPEESIEDIMTDYYRREKAAAERAERRRQESRPQILAHTYRGFHGGWGWGGYGGWGWGWGWWWPPAHTVYAPIVVPPPGANDGPGQWRRQTPVTVPHDNPVVDFPEDRADGDRPEGSPAADSPSDTGTTGGEPPQNVGADGESGFPIGRSDG